MSEWWCYALSAAKAIRSWREHTVFIHYSDDDDDDDEDDDDDGSTL